MSENRKLYDWRGVELKVGQIVIYGRHVGRSISPTVAVVTGFKISGEVRHGSFVEKVFSDDKVHLKPLDTAFGGLPEKEVYVMPERVTVVDSLPTKVTNDG